MAGTDRRTVGPLTAEEEDAYRRRREALLAAVSDLEAELIELRDAAAVDTARLERALTAARADVQRHVAESEGPDGLLARIVDEAPWLARRVERLRDEHEQLLARLDDLQQRVGASDPSAEVLEAAAGVVAELSAHRHRGTELLQDAFSLDLSSGE